MWEEEGGTKGGQVEGGGEGWEGVGATRGEGADIQEDTTGGTVLLLAAAVDLLSAWSLPAVVTLLEHEPGTSSRLLFLLLLLFSRMSVSSVSATIVVTTPLVTGVGAAKQNTGSVSTTSPVAVLRQGGGLGGGDIEVITGSFLLPLSDTLVRAFKWDFVATDTPGGEGGLGIECCVLLAGEGRGDLDKPLVRGRDVGAGTGE